MSEQEPTTQVDTIEPNTPESYVDDEIRAEEMAYREKPYRESASGLKKLAENLVKIGEEKAETAADEYDQQQKQVFDIAESAIDKIADYMSGSETGELVNLGLRDFEKGQMPLTGEAVDLILQALEAEPVELTYLEGPVRLEDENMIYAELREAMRKVDEFQVYRTDFGFQVEVVKVDGQIELFLTPEKTAYPQPERRLQRNLDSVLNPNSSIRDSYKNPSGKENGRNTA